MRTRGQAELALAERAEHLSRALGKAEVCVTVVDGARLYCADLPAKVFAAHSVVPLVQNCVGGDRDFGPVLHLGNDCDVYRGVFVPLSNCILDLAQGLHCQTCRQVTFILNKIAGLLHLIHVLIEVLIRSHLEQMEIIGDLGQSAAARELLLQHGYLVGFGRVRQRFHLALLVDV